MKIQSSITGYGMVSKGPRLHGGLTEVCLLLVTLSQCNLKMRWGHVNPLPWLCHGRSFREGTHACSLPYMLCFSLSDYYGRPSLRQVPFNTA